MMEFIFSEGDLSKEVLAQGDVIKRTPKLDGCFEGTHPFGADASAPMYLVVVTQSCDLVKSRLKIPHITLAPAKPFSIAVESFLEEEAKQISGSSVPYYPQRALNKVEDLVRRYLQNTVSDYFFLPEAGHPDLTVDLVVFLRSKIFVDVDHYDILTDAKVAELADVFRAKLGWLVGDMYSRVATPDFLEREPNPEEIKKIYYDKYVRKDDRIWLTGPEAKRLRDAVKQKRESCEADLSYNEIMSIRKTTPNHYQIVADNIIKRLIRMKLIDESNHELTDGIMDAVVAEMKLMS